MPYHRSPDSPLPPRSPAPERVLWTLTKGTDAESAQLQESDEFGVERQLLRNGGRLSPRAGGGRLDGGHLAGTVKPCRNEQPVVNRGLLTAAQHGSRRPLRRSPLAVRAERQVRDQQLLGRATGERA